MKKLLISLLLFLSILPAMAQQQADVPTRRPKIAVVLAGGGAKGVAHIPALKAIEEAGIPIDLVVGTSMGSIIGGMYCTGYSPDSMRKIINGTDWIKLITENPDFGNHSLSSKIANENYVLQFVIDKNRWKSGTGLGGVLQGRNVTNFFRRLTRFLPDSLDFGDMPIPFACVGTNAITGECKVFTHGNLPICLRASMAIPSAFTPVTIDSVVYVDGGVCDNFPVDVARRMGADIIIGVDLCVKTSEQQMTNSAIDLLMNCVDLYSRNTYQSNIADADIYIPIDVTGYSAASFSPEALDSLMCRGDYYVALKKPQLDSLRQAIHLDEEPIRIRIGDYSFAKVNEKERHHKLTEEQATRRSLYKANGGTLNSTMSIGGRFDNKEYATLLLRARMVLQQKSAALLKIETRLGERLQVKADISRRTFGTQRMGFYYKFQKHDINMYYRNSPLYRFDNHLNKFNLYFTQEWRNIRYTFGVNYNLYHYSDLMHTTDFLDDARHHMSERFFSYYIKGEVNNLDYQYFPTHGHRLEISTDLITDNLLTYQKKAILPIFSGNWDCALSCSERFCLQPHIFARIMVSEDIEQPLALMNMVGGLFNEQYYLQQRTFAGRPDLEFVEEDGLGILGITGQYSPFKNHYILLTADVCTHTNHIQNVLNSESLNFGIEASYNLRTSVGPLGIKAGWNDFNKSFSVTLNAGYYF